MVTCFGFVTKPLFDETWVKLAQSNLLRRQRAASHFWRMMYLDPALAKKHLAQLKPVLS